MKKILSVILCAAMALAIASCDTAEAPSIETKSGKDNDKTEATTEAISVPSDTAEGFNPEFTFPEPSESWMHIELDIKPWLVKLCAITMGKTTYPNTTDMSQMYFSGLNLGYEIHGSYDVSFEIKNYAITTYVKN